MTAVHTNRWFSVEEEEGYFFVHEPAAVNGAAVLLECAEGVVLVRQFRRPLGRWTLEIPRGYGEPGETVAACASREVREETGLEIPEGSLIRLGSVAPNSGVLAAQVALFYARTEAAPSAPLPKEREVQAVLCLPTAGLLARCNEGEVIDGFTYSALLLALARGLIDCGMPAVAPR